jgi:hypothetical protein
MCIVSFDKVLHITIHNQYPSLELTPPVYFSDGTTYCMSSNQQIDSGNTMETSFGIDSRQKNLKCVSLYKLQGKHTTKTDNQSDNNAASIENTTTNMHFLVAWISKNYRHNFCACLIEFTDDFAWDEDKLWALYREYNDQLHMGYTYSITRWSIYGNTTMKTKLRASYGSVCKLDIVISEGTEKYNMKKPIKIDPKRLVLSMLMSIVLIYAVRLNIRPSFKLNIRNQCLNVGLVSPIYIASEELDCHKPPNYKVYAGDTMRSAFIIMLHNQSYGALIYKLQKKQSHESIETNEDISSVIHFLVVWEISGSKKLCTGVLLVENDKVFVWDKDDLGKLHSKNINRFRLCPDSATETWLLDDNTALMTTFEIINEDYTLNITISEVERDDNTRKPAHIDLKR